MITYNNRNSKLVATLQLTTPSGQIAIHNVYNRSQTVNIGQLAATCIGRDCDILIGDFNLHHPLWSGDSMRNNVGSDARELAEATQAANMDLITARGTVTYVADS